MPGVPKSLLILPIDKTRVSYENSRLSRIVVPESSTIGANCNRLALRSTDSRAPN